MDRRLLRYYDRELSHLRELGGEFARLHPKIAGRLALDQYECGDPYVERLLEGFAFLSARIQLKLDAEFPRFAQNLLNTVLPHYLAPTPSMLIAQFEPDPSDPSLMEGFCVPRGTQLRSLIGRGEQTACTYTTGHDVMIWPLTVSAAQYHSRNLGAWSPPSADGRVAKAAVRLRLRCLGAATFDKLKIDDLVLHIQGSGDIPPTIHERLLADTIGIFARATGGNEAQHPWHAARGRPQIRPVGFEESEALLPCGPRSFQGYRLLHEYFAFPTRFMFLSLAGLGSALRATKAREADVLLLLSSDAHELEDSVGPEQFGLNCTPAVNLFPKTADRIHVSDNTWEFHVIPDRTRPLDFEVFEVQSLAGYGGGSESVRGFQPFYAVTERTADPRSGACFTVNRLPRTPTERERRRGTRSTYAGSEVYVSLVDGACAPYSPDLRQIGAETLCTNRDLPLRMPVEGRAEHFTMELSGPITARRCIAGPTRPRASVAEGDLAWRLISHMSLNYLSLADSDEVHGAAALRELLRVYSDLADAQTARQIDGVRSIRSKPITRQVPGPGPIAFARGLEVAVTLDDSAFEGTGIARLGAVLAEFFARYVSINSFTETVIEAAERGEVMRWPAKMGRQYIL